MSAPTTSTGRILWTDLGDSLAAQQLAELRAEDKRLGDELTALRRDLQQAESYERAEAEKADRRAFADAIRTGADDPGPARQAALEAELATMRRRQAALEEALMQITHDAQALIREHGADFAEDAEQRVASGEAAFKAAVDQLAKASAAWGLARDLQAWLEGERPRPLPVVPSLPHGAGGAPYDVSRVIAGLREVVEA